MVRVPDQTCLSTLSRTRNNCTTGSQSFYVLARSGDQLQLWSLPHFEELLQDTSPAVFPFLLKIKNCLFQVLLFTEYLFFSIEVELIYKRVLASHVMQTEKKYFFQITFHYRLSQGIEYSSLCYTVVPLFTYFIRNSSSYCFCFCCYVVSNSATPWTVAHQVPLSMGFSRQEHWNGLPFPSPWDLPNPGIEPASLASPILPGGFFTIMPHGKPV